MNLEYLTVFVLLALFLLFIGILTTLWIRAGFLLVGLCLKTAYDIGLYSPSSGKKRSNSTTGIGRGRSFILFARALQFVSRVIPGNSNRATHTWVIPVLVVGIPVLFVVIVVTVITPVFILWHVIDTGPAPWSLLLAVLGVCLYFILLVMGYYTLKHASIGKTTSDL